MGEDRIITGEGTVQFINLKTGEVVVELETTASSINQPRIQTYTSSGTSDWGTHQIGYPHAQYIWKEFPDRKIKYYKKELISDMYGTVSIWKKIELLIDRVIFNEPATIILWKDGIKTVVKTQDGEPFDKEKGFLMAIAKYLNRDKANYNNLIKKWCPEDDEVDEN